MHYHRHQFQNERWPERKRWIGRKFRLTWKGMIVNTVTASFNTIMGQMTEMFQWKKNSDSPHIKMCENAGLVFRQRGSLCNCLQPTRSCVGVTAGAVCLQASRKNDAQAAFRSNIEDKGDQPHTAINNWAAGKLRWLNSDHKQIRQHAAQFTRKETLITLRDCLEITITKRRSRKETKFYVKTSAFFV